MIDDAMVDRAARTLAAIAARATGWTTEDVWAASGTALLRDARAMLTAALAVQPSTTLEL